MYLISLTLIAVIIYMIFQFKTGKRNYFPQRYCTIYGGKNFRVMYGISYYI